MAESPDKIRPSNRRFNFLLSCFGSPRKVRRQQNPASIRADRPVRWFRFRSKKPSATVPVDAAVPEITDKASISPDFENPPTTSIPPAVRTEIVETIEPIRVDSAMERFPLAERTVELSFPSRQLNRQKDLKKSVFPLTPASKPPASKLEAAIVIVAVAIVVLWGRIGAILCITALFCFCRRLRSEL